MTLTTLTFYAPPAVGGVIPPLQLDLNLPTGGDPTMGGDLSGTASTAQIVAGAIVDADINAAAGIAESKIANLVSDLAAKAPIASPTFTGTTTAPEYSASGLTGATAASRYVGATASGAPASGTFAVGDFVIAQSGSIWVCTAAGTPGTWTQLGAGGPPTGTAGGDLAGTYPNPTVKAGVGLTGVPTTPTAAVDTNTTQIASTAFVLAQAASANPVMDGSVAVGTSTRYARADHVHASDTSRAPLASPTLTGVPAAPTAAVDTNTTQLATTAFVLAQAASATPLANANPAVGTSTRYARADHVHARTAFYLNGSANHVRETTPRHMLGSGDLAGVLTSGVMLNLAIELFAGDVITNITFRTGATAAGTPTHWWVALYDTQATPALLAQSADQTTGAIAANTNITKALTAAQTIVTSGVYYVSIMVAATTTPTLRGLSLGAAAMSSAIVTGQKVLSQNSGASLTTTAPATIASPAATGQLVYMVTS